MGLALSVFLAHGLACAIARRCASAARNVVTETWVDNVAWAGARVELEKVQTAAAIETEALNCEWSAAPRLYTDSFVFLGLAFCLRTKTISTTDAVRQRLLDGPGSLGERCSIRAVLVVVGLALWANYACARVPLSFVPALLSWLRAAGAILSSSGPPALDEQRVLPPGVRDEIATFCGEAALAKLSLDDLLAPPLPSTTLFCDASFAAVAAVARHGHFLSVRSAAAPEGLDIFALEALGAWVGLSAVPRGPPAKARVAIDNLNLIAALRRGHSANPVVNAVLRAFFAEAWSRRLRVETVAVRSAENLADFPSRNRPLPDDWRRYFAALSGASLVPFFRPPRAAREEEREEERGHHSTDELLAMKRFGF